MIFEETLESYFNELSVIKKLDEEIEEDYLISLS